MARDKKPVGRSSYSAGNTNNDRYKKRKFNDH